MLGDEDVPAVLALYRQGAGLVALARQFKVGRRAIEDALRANEVPIRPRGRPRGMVPGSRRHQRALRTASLTAG